MHMLRYICLLCLLLASPLGPGHAQTGGKAGDKPADKAGEAPPAASSAGPQTSAEADSRRRDWFAQCMADWDSGTHMNKTEWERTCRRMAQERMKYLLDQRK